MKDLYHFFLVARWGNLFITLVSACLLITTGFAALYYVAPGSIGGAAPNSFLDAFFFSAQTLSTVGYGNLHPVGTVSNILATTEAFIGLGGFAMGSALVFAKFSRPTARVLFSKNAIISKRDGKPVLMFRMANSRHNQILDAQINLVFIRSEKTAEGETFRRMHDLKLQRPRTPMFALTWTAVHPIDETSPLWSQTPDSLKKDGAGLFITFLGTDETFSATVSTRHTYEVDHILWNHQFVDILSFDANNRPKVDLRHFHEAKPI